MFAIYNRDRFSGDKARNTENLLDVLQHAGVTVLWRDNNSDSKGVARRVPFEDFRSPDTNPVCDLECRDEGMLEGLQSFIDGHPSGDILVVLHPMGSHGPAYHKRYPADFRRFTPTCDTSQLDACSEEQIGNSYDNTLLYTDYFLSKVISLLRDNDEHFETAMIYASDHGESLGEGGLYLHGLPYFVAPEAQTHVPMVFWFGHRFDGARIEALRQLADRRYSHDNLFHTLLGLFEIETDVYQPNMDILREARMLEGGSPEYH
jgi:lipid A ethanolaminephosphotransferase